jgi:hypothetical protein
MARIRHLIPTVAVTLTTVMLAAPAAQARPAGLATYTAVGSDFQRNVVGNHPMGHWVRGPGFTAGPVPASSPLKNQLSVPADAEANVPATLSTGSGFDRTAAAIGASATLLLVLLGLNHRTRRVRHLAA